MAKNQKRPKGQSPKWASFLGEDRLSLFSQGFYLGRGGMKVKKLSIGRLALRLLIFLAILGVFFVVFSYMARDRFLFHPVKGLEMSIKDAGWEYEEVWLKGTGGARVNGWYAPGPKGRHVALLLHGNGGNLTDMVGRIMTYHWLQMGVLAIDYEGYGLSEGSPSLDSAVQNAVAAWDYLTLEKKIEPEKIVVHGYSLGGGVAGQLVKIRPVPHPLVMDSTFTSLTEAAESSFPLLGPLPRLVLGGAYDTRAALKDYRATVAIFLHSKEDEVINYRLGLSLYESYANSPKAFVELRGSHVNYPANSRLYEKALIDNLKLTFPKAPEKSSGEGSFEAESGEASGNLSGEGSGQAVGDNGGA
jgi:pimeloyl-ACP methyl ester carboxylesterase